MDFSNVSPQQSIVADVKPVKKNKIKRKKVSSKPSRVELMARPSIRRLQNAWNDGSNAFSATHRDKIKSFLEEDQFTNPKRTEDYFRRLGITSNCSVVRRANDAQKMTSQAPHSRSQWLEQFSAQVARKLCSWVVEKKDQGNSKTADNDTVLELADIVLARVSHILGEKTPKRSDPSRLARFMIVVSDRIAVWIDGVVKGNVEVNTKQRHGTKTRTVT